MAQLLVRNVDEETVARLKARAAAHGRSIEAEHREILRAALDADPQAEFRRLAALSRAATTPYRNRQTPAEVLQRETREEQ
jgi:plasmid stability protein